MHRDRRRRSDGGDRHRPGHRHPPGRAGRRGRQREPAADHHGPRGPGIPDSRETDRHQPRPGRPAQKRQRLRPAHRHRDHRRIRTAGTPALRPLHPDGRTGPGREPAPDPRRPPLRRNGPRGGLRGHHSPRGLGPRGRRAQAPPGLWRGRAGRGGTHPRRAGRLRRTAYLEHASFPPAPSRPYVLPRRASRRGSPGHHRAGRRQTGHRDRRRRGAQHHHGRSPGRR